MTKYFVVDKFLGYQNKTDVTKLRPGVLIYPSQNVIVENGETVVSLKNYSLDGELGAETDFGVVASYEWLKSTLGYSYLRAGGDELQVRYVDADGVISWLVLKDGWASTLFNFVSVWDADEEIDVLVFVNGDSNLYVWSGATTTYASATSSTITRQGSDSWATSRFFTENETFGGSTTQFDITLIGGTTYRYTYDATGTNPNITATNPAIGTTLYISAQNFNAANNGIFVVTGSGVNYFEVTNASGVAESNKTIGTGFIDKNPKSITVDGDTYYYRGGESTATLTNVTPNPSTAAYAAGTIIMQGVQTYRNYPANNSDFFTNDIIGVLYNQIWVGSHRNQEVYVSSQSDILDYSFSDPRLPGEGVIIRFDAPPRAFAPNEESMQTSCGETLWYKSTFELSSTQTAEAVTTTLLKSGASQGAISQGGTFYIKNSVAYISNEPTLDTLGKVENIITVQTVPISDPIQKDFNRYDFTRVHGKFYKNFIYVALPLESRIIAYDIEQGYWNAPWLLPAGRIAIIDEEVYFHSNVTMTTYKMFEETSILETDIIARAIFSYINNDDRVNFKIFNERFSEGFIKSNTSVQRYDYLDWKGYTETYQDEIRGNDQTIILDVTPSNALGENPLGEEPLGDTYDEVIDEVRFRVIRGCVGKSWREVSTEFISEGVNQLWKITSFGYNTTSSSQNNSDITQ